MLHLLAALHVGLRHGDLSPLAAVEGGHVALLMALLCCPDGAVRRVACDALLRVEVALAHVGLRDKGAVQ